MDFFDNLSEMISSKGKEAKEVAKKVAEIANLKGKISGLETEVKKNYRKIGEAYYEAYKAAEVTCEFEEYVQAIRDAKKSIEELTFKFATGNDWWFHAKGVPGSHVIVKTEGADDMPDATFEEAGRLAAYYSQSRGNEKVEIDYIQKKQIKKPKGGKPGFVVYYTNYSLMIDSDISAIQQI